MAFRTVLGSELTSISGLFPVSSIFFRVNQASWHTILFLLLFKNRRFCADGCFSILRGDGIQFVTKKLLKTLALPPSLDELFIPVGDFAPPSSLQVLLLITETFPLFISSFSNYSAASIISFLFMKWPLVSYMGSESIFSQPSTSSSLKLPLSSLGSRQNSYCLV